MTTPQQVKQALALSLNLASDLKEAVLTPQDRSELIKLVNQIQVIIDSTKTPSEPTEPTVKKTLKHPVDALLKKGKVTLSEKRYYHLTEIYDELTKILKVKFLGAKQNQDATWFPLECQGDKSAALFLHAGEWSIAPLSRKANGELSGVWEDFDLSTQMQSNRPEVDLDDY